MRASSPITRTLAPFLSPSVLTSSGASNPYDMVLLREASACGAYSHAILWSESTDGFVCSPP